MARKKGLTKMQLKSRLLSGAAYVVICVLMIVDGFQGHRHGAGYLAIAYLVLVLAWIGYSIWQYRHHPVTDADTDETVLANLRMRSLALAIVGGGILLFLLTKSLLGA